MGNSKALPIDTPTSFWVLHWNNLTGIFSLPGVTPSIVFALAGYLQGT